MHHYHGWGTERAIILVKVCVFVCVCVCKPLDTRGFEPLLSDFRTKTIAVCFSKHSFCTVAVRLRLKTGGPSMYCVRWSNEAATIHADITADHRDVPVFVMARG